MLSLKWEYIKSLIMQTTAIAISTLKKLIQCVLEKKEKGSY